MAFSLQNQRSFIQITGIPPVGIYPKQRTDLCDTGCRKVNCVVLNSDSMKTKPIKPAGFALVILYVLLWLERLLKTDPKCYIALALALFVLNSLHPLKLNDL